VPGELCSYCLTGHGPAWQDFPDPPPNRFARFMLRHRITRWFLDADD